MERVQSFALPATFPEVLVPDQLLAFMKSCVDEAVTTDEMRDLAEAQGYAPLWQPLPQFGERVYGFGLDMQGLQVPFVVCAGVEQ